VKRETQHYHGTVLHDHERGHVRHDHEGLPVSGTGSPYRGEAMLALGVIIAVAGGAGMLWKSNDHSACGSALVQATAPGQCSEANFIWTAGIIALAIGAVMTIAGAIMRSKS
jgi:hypothetical protein